jgi:peptide/nickel transport system permease protein
MDCGRLCIGPTGLMGLWKRVADRHPDRSLLVPLCSCPSASAPMTVPVSSPDAPRNLTPRPAASSLVRLGKRVGQRLGGSLLTLLITSFLSFLLIQLAPGDFLDQLRENPQLDPETIKIYARNFGLDRPWLDQYGLWLAHILGWNQGPQGWSWGLDQVGNFGKSFTFNRDVLELLKERVPATLLLALSSLVMTWAIAIPLGIWAAVHHNRPLDRAIQALSYLGQGFPSVIAALFLLLVAQNASPWLPIGDMTSINHPDFSPLGKVLDVGWHLLLPTLALSVTGFSGLQRIMRGQFLDVLRQDYIRTARAKGLPENQVIYRHALRNAINPLITLLGFEFAGLLSGAVITEQLFNWPGLGRLILQALSAQDLYLVMASLMMGALLLVVGNLLADLLLALSDPRIKL